MYEKVFEQAESFLKPMSEIFALNMQAFDKLREQQAELYNELVNDGIEYAKDISKPSTDIAEIFATHQSYFSGVKDKIAATTCSNCDYWSDIQGKSGELWQSAIDSNVKSASAAAPAKKKAPAKKTAKKAAAKTAAAAEKAEAAVESPTPTESA